MQTTRPDQPELPRGGQEVARTDLTASPPHSIDSATLLGARRVVQIRHKGAIYTLRETRQGKLILNK